MFKAFGKLAKWSLVGLLVVAVASATMGKSRVHDMVSTVRHNVNEGIDGLLDTRVVLENKLRAVQEEFPEKIAQVKIQIRQLTELIDNIDSERGVYNKVVTLCNDDLALLEPQLEAAEASGNTSTNVSYKAQELSYTGALSQANKIMTTRVEYENLLDVSARDTQTLQTQRDDMQVYLIELQQEFQLFMNEAAKLQHEIEIIDRNEKLATLVDSQRDYRGYTLKDDVSSLSELKSRIAEARIYQEEKLRSKRIVPVANDYEARVRLKAQSR